MIDKLRFRCRKASGASFAVVVGAIVLLLDITGGIITDSFSAGSNADFMIAVAVDLVACAILWLCMRPKNHMAYAAATWLTGLPVFVASLFGAGATGTLIGLVAVTALLLLYVKFRR